MRGEIGFGPSDGGEDLGNFGSFRRFIAHASNFQAAASAQLAARCEKPGRYAEAAPIRDSCREQAKGRDGSGRSSLDPIHHDFLYQPLDPKPDEPRGLSPSSSTSWNCTPKTAEKTS